MQIVPSEVAIYGMYYPPYLLVGIAAALLAGCTALVLNRYRLSRYFFYPPLVFLSLAIIYGSLISMFVIPA